MCLINNRLPVITFELKNHLTKQNVDDACIKFCTRLAGKDCWFLPFDKGYNDGAGNPPNSNGPMTDFLWKDILTKEKRTLIIEKFERDLDMTINVCVKDVEAAQWGMLEKMEEVKECM